MATISQIHTNLLKYAQNRDFVSLKNTVNGITADQVPQLDSVILGNSLNAIVSHSSEDFITNNDQLIADAVRNFSGKLINEVPNYKINDALLTLAQDRNFAGIDGITDYLSAQTKQDLGAGGEAVALGDVLKAIVSHSSEDFITNNDQLIADAVRNFSGKLINEVPNYKINDALLTLAQDRNFAGIDGITDYLSAQTKQDLGAGGEAVALGDVLKAIVSHSSEDFITNNDQLIADAVRNFSGKLINEVPNYKINDALLTLAQDRNFAGIDGITDYLSAQTKQDLGAGGEAVALGDVLKAIVSHSSEDFITNNDQLIADAVRNFSGKLINEVPNYKINDALLTLAQDRNFAGIDGITDYLSAQTKQDLGAGGEAVALGDVLKAIVSHTSEDFITDNNKIVTNAVRDFASKLLVEISHQAVVDSLHTLAVDGNFRAEAALLDYMGADFSKSELAAATGHYFLDGDTTPNAANLTPWNDTVFGRNGNDNIHGGDGNDVIAGNKDHDTLYGENGNDLLIGGTGNDHLYDGGGLDSMWGDGGYDVFHLSMETTPQHDRICDFTIGTDKVVIESAWKDLSQADKAIVTKFVQSGADVLMQVDTTLMASGISWQTVALFRDMSAETLNANENLIFGA